MDDNERAVLTWIATFGLSERVDSLIDLVDGSILSQILHVITNDYFSVLSKDTQNEWTNRASNIETILLAMRDYYMQELGVDIDISGLDIKEITREYNPDQMMYLLELVLGIAVQCSTKSVFIRAIISLDLVTETVLKSMIENVLNNSHPCLHGGATRTLRYGGTEENSEALLRAQEMVKHLQGERQRFVDAITTLSATNTTLTETNAEVNKRLAVYESDMENDGGRNAKGISTAAQYEIDNLKQDMDLKNIEVEELKDELYNLNMRLTTTKEALTKAEATANMMVDEVDVARDKAARLIKAENTIEKYQKRLEEFSSLKKINKELEEKLDEYLDKINQLEDSSKNLNAVNRVGEQYKDKALEEERLRLEALSHLQMKEAEIEQLKADLKRAIESRRLMEVELNNARMQLEQMSDDEEENEGVLSITSLKEKIKRLEFELRQARANAGGGEGGDAAMREELEALRKTKRERDEALFAANKQISEYQNEMNRLSALVAAGGGGGGGDSSAMVKVLQDQLRERSDAIDRLTLERNLMMTTVARTLANFKDKYIGIILALRNENKAMENKLVVLTSRSERNKETRNREERLVLSALYNMGLGSIEEIHALKKKQ